MKTYMCPKCGNDEYYLSKRNVQTGRGVFLKASFKVLPVCKQCDELMLENSTFTKTVNKAKDFGLILCVALVILMILIELLSALFS